MFIANLYIECENLEDLVSIEKVLQASGHGIFNATDHDPFCSLPSLFEIEAILLNK